MSEFQNLPEHVAIIMDGNGRWAEAKGLKKYFGHDAGMRSMTAIVRYASDIGIKYLTVYAFSTENWKRSVEEVSGIFKLLTIYVDKELDELRKNNVKVNIIGDISEMPKHVLKALDKTITRTRENNGLEFNICLGYGGRAEIINATKIILNKVACGEIKEEDVSEELFSKQLYTGDAPDPDLIIRPGGEKRLSNFLLWQSAYSELVFSDVLWPDYTTDEFDKALNEYNLRKRRFGGR